MTGRQEAGSVRVPLGLPLTPDVGGRLEGPSDVTSAAVWDRLPVPQVSGSVCTGPQGT